MIKIAIIGCGRIFNKHYIAINNTTGIKLVAVCDIDKKNLKIFLMESLATQTLIKC